MDPINSDCDPFIKNLIGAIRSVLLDIVKLCGKKAPSRKRKRRIADKLKARGGYMHHKSFGAWCAKEDRRKIKKSNVK